MKEYMATSLDGWLVIKYDGTESEHGSDASELEDEGRVMDQYKYHRGLERKTPSSKKLLQNKIRTCINLYGAFSQCEFRSSAFRQLVYKPDYCVQVLHHATVTNLRYILFVVTGTTKVHHAVLIHFPDTKVAIMTGLLSGIYNRSLKWAYTMAWVSNDLQSCIPDF